MRHVSTWPMLAVIAVITVVSVLFVWPGWPKQYLPDFIDYPTGPILDLGNDAMRLGLDLKGGTYLLTEANLAALPKDRDPDQAMDSIKQLMENRVNEFGVAETEVTREGRNRIAIQVPGIAPDQARDLIGRTALLRFMEPTRDEAGNITCQAEDGTQFSVPLASVKESVDKDGNKVEQCAGGSGQTGTVIWKPAASTVNGQVRELTGAQVNGAEATVSQGSSSGWVVILNFNGEGNTLFTDISGRLAGGYPLGIFLDTQLISAPGVQGQISGNSTQIENVPEDEAKNLAKLISAGALPVPLTTIQATEVDATLGQQTLVRGVQAGLIGILAVMAFMILYYRLPGILASTALFTYIVVVMAIFKAVPITITLAGIAGFVLSVGMAVDANILVFERLKEELRAGRALPSAIEHGFDRAWTSIRDSNVSTLITCGILWWFGNQFNAALVKGFAITLAIGVIVSLFSAIIVTRTLLRALVSTPVGRMPWLFATDLHQKEGEPQKRTFAFDFVRRRGMYFALSALLLVPGIISLGIPPHIETGIEFSSGATFTLKFDDANVSQNQVETAFSDLGFGDARVQRSSGEECSNAACYIVRTRAFNIAPSPPLGPTPPSERDQVEAQLKEKLGSFTTLNFNQVSSIISSSIVWDAIIAVIFAAAAILVYISWSFRNVPQSYRYGIAAVVAALHDAVFVVGAFSILGHLFGTEINSLFITGVLTVIGFSVHDTIVVFDRIRENVSTHPGVRFDEVVNASLTETLARSINTSFAVILTIIALLLMSGGQIDVLLIALLLGITAGTYSSIFIASQILVAWEDGDFDPFFSAIAFWRRGRQEPGAEPIAASRV